jgi:hypothetical protein
MAIVKALFVPTSTTNFFPLVNPGIDQIPLEQDVVLNENGNDHGRIFRSLLFMETGAE